MIGIGISTAFPRSMGSAPGPRPLLLIVAGQSNAGKQGTSGLTPPAKYGDLGSFRIWSGSAFTDYDIGANPGDYGTAWGTEAEFVHRLRGMGQTRPVYLVKRVQGATSLAAASGADWAPGSGELFADAQARVSAARAAILANDGQAPEEVTLWNQGERDIQNAARAAAYATNFSAFLAAWRAQVSTGLFIVERTRPFPGHYGASFEVRRAQLDTVLAQPLATAIDSDFSVADPWSELHPGPDWCEGLGARAFDAWRGAYAATWGDIADASPDPVVFTDLGGQAAGDQVTSEIVEPAGFSRDVTVSVAGGDYRILHPDDSVAVDWTSAPGRLHRWQKLQLRQTAAAAPETGAAMGLTLGGAETTWTVTTAAANDSTPDPFDFIDLTGQAEGVQVVSDIVAPTGFDAPAAMSVVGGEVRRLDAGDTQVEGWTATPGSLLPGEKLQLRGITAASAGTAVTVSVTVGGVTADWQATTQSAVPEASYLIVGGGGPGGQGGGAGVGAGGGGGGGVLTGTVPLAVGSYPITVGAGGAVSTANGGASSAFGLTALGGGRGADTIGGQDLPGYDGASGGGGSGHNTGFDVSGGAGLQGTPGGAGHQHGSQMSQRNGGGGGGAGTAGEAAGPDHGGAGGEGVTASITGVAEVYGSGGGGGQNLAGGKYAGFPPGGTNAGSGGWKDQPVTAPVQNTGAGGAGSSGSAAPTAGADGVVVVAYPTGSVTATGGVVSVTGGMTVHRFDGSGVFEVTG